MTDSEKSQHEHNHGGGAFDSEEEFKSLPEFTLSDKYSYLKRKLSKVISEKESFEGELVKAKIHWAEIELSHENAELKLKKQMIAQ